MILSHRTNLRLLPKVYSILFQVYLRLASDITSSPRLTPREVARFPPSSRSPVVYLACVSVFSSAPSSVFAASF